MKNKKIVFPLLLVLIVLGVDVSTSVYLGYKLDHQASDLKQFFEEQPNFRVSKSAYHRGVFSSSGEATLVLNGTLATAYREALSQFNADAASLEVTVKQHITHGPFPGWLKGNFKPARAMIVTEVVWPAAVQAELQKVYGDTPALTITTLVALNGDNETTITNPAFTKPLPKNQGSVSWKGFSGTVAYDAAFTQAKTHFESDGLSAVVAAGGKMEIGKIQFTSETHREFGEFLSGKGSGSIAGLEVVSAMPGIPNVKVGQISYDANSVLTGEFLDIAAKVGVESVLVQNVKYGPIHYDVSLNHVHAPSLAKLSRALVDVQKQATTPELANSMMMGALLQHGVPLLKQTPVFHLDRISVQLPEGEAKLTASAKVVGFDGSEIQQPATLLGKLDAEVSLAFPEAVARTLAMTALNRKAALEGGDTTAQQAQITAMIDQQIETLITQGLVNRAKPLLNTHVAWKLGKLMVNGKQYEPAQLLMLGLAGLTPPNTEAPAEPAGDNAEK